VIALRDIGFSYDDRLILDGVGLDLDEGELVVVSGRTGSGKSTLLGVVTGLVPRFSGGTLRGDVRLDGESVLGLPPRERAHVIGHVGQDPASGFVTDTVEEELAFGMEQLGVVAETMRRRVEETLDLLGIADLRSRDLRTLSGGQQQRVALGSVLTMHPRLLVLDEPTSALDPTAAEEVLATLTRLVHDLGVTVLMAEHRLERVVPFADRMALLDGRGGLITGPPEEVLAVSPVAPPLIELGRLAGWKPLPLSVRDARRLSTSLQARLGPPPAPAEQRGREPAVRASRVTVRHGRKVAVREVDLRLDRGVVTGLMGRNGSGKTSLIWTLQGTGRRTTGTVSVAGQDPADLEAAARRALVGLVPQSAADLLYLETVAEECVSADESADAEPGRCRALLDRFAPGVPDDQHPRDLSEGQRLSLVLAVVLTGRPPVLLLDEPTRGLDYTAKAQLADVLTGLAADDHAVLVASHDVEFMAQVADRVVVLAEGEVVSAGPAHRVLPESPGFAPQVTKVLGPPWLRVDEVAAALRVEP